MSEIVMREPCKSCDQQIGRIDERNGQDCVFCLNCGQWAYNRPRIESGKAVRSTSPRPGIKPSKRRWILDRDKHCQVCGRSEGQLHIGHIVSRADCLAAGISEDNIDHELNLRVECEECNLGAGRRSPDPVVVAYLRLQLGAA